MEEGIEFKKSTMIYGAIGLVAVIAIAFFAFGGGLNTTGFAVDSNTTATNEVPKVLMVGLNKAGFNTLTVEAGKPVTLKNDGTLSGCGLYPNQPEIGMNANFANSNEYTFTPTKKGTFIYTCSMGVFKGTINVV